MVLGSRSLPHGDGIKGIGRMKRIDWVKRFWGNVTRGAPDECWIWKGFLNSGGYGTIRVGDKSKKWPAHRASYYLHGFGKVPDGLVLDHQCNTPSCVNPNHLKPMTNWQNALRSPTPNAFVINFTKKLCGKGLHEMSGWNLMKQSDGCNRCRKCSNLYMKGLHEKRRRALGIPIRRVSQS